MHTRTWAPRTFHSGMPSHCSALLSFQRAFLASPHCATLQVNEQFPNRTSRRVMHGSVQIVSTAFAAMGVMTVIGTHSVNGLSNVGAGHVSNAYKVHAWLGYVSVGFILAQVGCRTARVVLCSSLAPPAGGPSQTSRAVSLLSPAWCSLFTLLLVRGTPLLM